jgi:hypothetical protein
VYIRVFHPNTNSGFQGWRWLSLLFRGDRGEEEGSDLTPP